jgi:hypothetical protein
MGRAHVPGSVFWSVLLASGVAAGGTSVSAGPVAGPAADRTSGSVKAYIAVDSPADPVVATSPRATLGTPGLGGATMPSRPMDPTFDPGVGGTIEETVPTSRPGPPIPLPAPRPARSGAAPRVPLARKHSVPEPASILLVVTGLIGLAARRHLLRNRP